MENFGLSVFNEYLASRILELKSEIPCAHYKELRLIATGEWNTINNNPLKFEQFYTIECLKVYRGQDIHTTIDNFNSLDNANACFNTVKKWKEKELASLKQKIQLLLSFENLLYSLL